MVNLRSLVTVFFIVTFLGAGACQRKVTSLSLSTGSYSSTPVILTEMRVNGVLYRFEGHVVAGMSDIMMPRGSASWSITIPEGLSDPVRIETSWTEILTNRAYSATIEAPLKKFDVYQIGQGWYKTTITPIYGPNGLLVIASDPIPTSADNIPKNDVARICGVRVPSADKDWRSEVNNVGGHLKNAYARTYPPVENPECPDLEQ